MDYLNILTELESLCVFRSVLNNEAICALAELLNVADGEAFERSNAFSNFVYKLYSLGYDNLTYLVRDLVNDSENPYVVSVCTGAKPSSVIEDSIGYDLVALNKISQLTPSDFGFAERKAWSVDANVNIADEYMNRIKNINKYGYGIYSKHKMFYVDADGEILPVKHPDTIQISDLAEYEVERNRILDNTRAFLDGKPASDILLTGDAGTGKSTTIKAVANALSTDGLRIVELRKEQLSLLPKLVDRLAFNPLKFIIFIDDLSFIKADDNFNALKAMLEGSVSSYSTNIKVYVTSNRRHLIKESFADREGDDIHRNDTMQEIISLSERFGIHITYSRPDKTKYLNIVRHYMELRGIDFDEHELEIQAERYALQKSSRSARAARQFADNVESGIIKVK